MHSIPTPAAGLALGTPVGLKLLYFVASSREALRSMSETAPPENLTMIRPGLPVNKTSADVVAINCWKGS